jgi:hypothetical protein
MSESMTFKMVSFLHNGEEKYGELRTLEDGS